jgi:hypothetical protein
MSGKENEQKNSAYNAFISSYGAFSPGNYQKTK